MINTAFILGAGLGTRLRPLTERMPKPLLSIASQPMICHAMDRLMEAGVTRFIVNTHHCAEAYAVAFPASEYRGCPITFVHEPVLLDTGGGLKNIEPFWSAADDSLFVYNGDIFAFPNLACLSQTHALSNAEATLLLRSQGEPRNVRMNDASEIIDMRGRLGTSAGKLCLFAGIYIVRRDFLRALEPGRIESVVEGFLRRMVASPESIHGVLDDSGFWYDLGTVPEYERVKEVFQDRDFSRHLKAES